MRLGVAKIAETAAPETHLHPDKPAKIPMTASDIPRDPESMIGLPSPLLDIQSRTFATVRRGYDRAEVDAFLKRLAETISELLEERTALSADAAADLDPESVAESMVILEDAEARASRRLHAATLEADRLRTEARRTLDKAIKEAQEVENAARANAEQITAEAAEMRQQILRDLLRRRQEAQTHVEMLRAARDELLNVFNQVRRITAQVKDPLDSALDRAKQAADSAAKRTQEEPQESLTQFEAELQTARLSGVIPIPAEAEREAVREHAVLAEEAVASTDASEAVMEADDSAEARRRSPAPELAESGQAASEALASEPADELPPAAEPVPAGEPSAAIAAEPAEAQDGGDMPELSAPEPELGNIFARLRESATRPESRPEAEAESAAESEAESQIEQPAKSLNGTGKKAARKRTSRKKVSRKADADPSVADAQVSGAQVSDAPQLEDLKRQIKRALTTDESKVLQAIHRLHKKAPKKAEELRGVLADQDARTGEFAQLLPAPSRDIQSLLVVPLAADLSACDIEEADTKTLIQQVRDVYRSFSQEQIAPVAAELAKHALEN